MCGNGKVSMQEGASFQAGNSMEERILSEGGKTETYLQAECGKPTKEKMSGIWFPGDG